jgi:hypothetical protein
MAETVQYETWKTRDGRELRIVDMEDSHLVATIRMLEKQADKRYDEDCKAVPYWGSEDAEMMPERSWYVHPKLPALLLQARSRGIAI